MTRPATSTQGRALDVRRTFHAIAMRVYLLVLLRALLSPMMIQTSHHRGDADDTGVDVSWLVQSRWGMVAAFLVALLLSELGAVQRMDAASVLAGAAITVLTNLVAPIVRHHLSMGVLTVGLLVFDILVLTAVLYVTGGAANPLSALYLMPIALAAVMLAPRYSWILAGLTASMFFLLFFSPESHRHQIAMGHQAPSHHMDHAHHGPLVAPAASPSSVFDLHLRGMWMAFTLTAVSMAYFVTRVSQALRKRDAQLDEARARAFRAERVASLASLAASTAHELATPLSSIGLAASEMRRAIDSGKPASALTVDADMVRTEVKRCREIIDAMLGAAGETTGETPAVSDATTILREAIDGLPREDAERIAWQSSMDSVPIHAPHRIVSQALQNLIRNAVEVSPQGAMVEVDIVKTADRVRFTIRDKGPGMDARSCAQAFEPFITSKAGRGRGMGLFFVNSVATRLGGEVRLESSLGHGTHAILEIPVDTVTMIGRDDSPHAQAPDVT